MDNITQKKLEQLVKSDYWESMGIFSELLIKKWNSVPLKAENEFETLWNVAFLQGKIEGAKELLDSAEKISCQ